MPNGDVRKTQWRRDDFLYFAANGAAFHGIVL
jgi:hypothetical protein